ncbi:MAG TPA: BTB/POZ domain-containing protein, partial [Rhabdochlamydiaceae bacterium]|nr:BTB/POZ domain-containing protein [Rhabdochlamydiaceae bacterium]
VVATVKNAQFSHKSCCISLESIPIPSSGYHHFTFIQHVCIIAQILYRSYGIEVKQIDDEMPPQTLTVTWHYDAHWLNPPAPFQIKDRKEESLTDCTLQFGEKRFSAHRTVLSAKSSVFEKMFKSQCKEAEWGAVISIVMENFEGQSAEILLDYFYTGELKLKGASVKQIDNLVNFSAQYDMPRLRQLCFEHLCQSVDADTLKDYITLARHYQHEKLEAALIEHIGVEVTVDNFDRLMELGKADKLGDVFTQTCTEVILKQIKEIKWETLEPGKCTQLNEYKKFLDLAFKLKVTSMVFTTIDHMKQLLGRPRFCLEKLIEYLTVICEYHSRLEAEGNWLQKDENDILTMKNGLIEDTVKMIDDSGTKYSYEVINKIPIIKPIDLKLIEQCLTVATAYKLENIINHCDAVLAQEFVERPSNYAHLSSIELQQISNLASQYSLKRVKEAYEKTANLS